MGEKITEEKIVYVNREIHSKEEDILGISAYAESVSTAVKQGATMIGVIADYGTGKSSLTELIATNKDVGKVIKVNMWDSLKNDDPCNLELDKAFLSKVAQNSGNKSLARHVNKRLNSKSGFISFTMKSSMLWIYIMFAIVFFIGGVFLTSVKFDYPFWNENFNSVVSIICYVIAIMLLAIYLSKGGIAFSSWKTEGTTKFEQCDIYSIFSEMVETLRYKYKSTRARKKKLIVIEDLDRAKDVKLIIPFLKELYRFAGMCREDGIVFLVSIMPEETLLEGQESLRCKIQYSKIFDYIVELKPIHADDSVDVLDELLKTKEENIKKLLNTEELNYSDFAILAEGKNLTIRDIKHRINSALVLYESLREKGDYQSYINIRTCCVVAYLQSQFEKDFQKLLKDDMLFSEIIKDGITEKIAPRAYEDKIKNLVSKFNLKVGNDKFCERLVRFIINGDINSDYRQYFYNYPKGSYFKCAEEVLLQEVLFYPKENKLTDKEFNMCVEKALLLGGKIIDISINALINRNYPIPMIIFKNEKLLEYCYDKFPKIVIDSLQANAIWHDDCAHSTSQILGLINKYNFSNKTQLLEDYGKRVAESFLTNDLKTLVCRFEVLKTLGNNIIYLHNIFKSTNSSILTKEELNLVKNEETFLLLFNPDKIDSTFIIALSQWHIKKYSEKVVSIVFDAIAKLILGKSLSKEIFVALINLLINNKLINEKIFTALMNSYYNEEIELIEKYLNLFHDVPSSYLKGLQKNNIIIKISNSLMIDRFYEEKLYRSFILNAIHNEYYSEYLFDGECINAPVLNDIYNINKEVFYKYRSNLLRCDNKKKEKYSFIFSSPFPFVIDNEKNLLTDKDIELFFNDNLISLNVDAFVQIIKNLVKTAEVAYNIAKFVLKTSRTWSISVFNQIPFAKIEFNGLEVEKKVEIVRLYEKIVRFSTISEILRYIRLTNDLLIDLEQEIYSRLLKINKAGISASLKADYINTINGVNQCSNITIDTLSLFNYKGKLNSQITNKLLAEKKYEAYVIGTTLYNHEFVYNEQVPYMTYINLYATNNEVYEYMNKNIDFIKLIHCKQNFANMDISRLKELARYGYSVKLLKELFAALPTDAEREALFLEVESMPDEEANKLTDLVCRTEYRRLLKSKPFSSKAEKLMRKASIGKKSYLSRIINEEKSK